MRISNRAEGPKKSVNIQFKQMIRGKGGKMELSGTASLTIREKDIADVKRVVERALREAK